jgi:hypothetical protein
VAKGRKGWFCCPFRSSHRALSSARAYRDPRGRPDQLGLLQRWLAQDGHDVHGYLSGREAMMRATRESFDLFVLDWQVPDVSGAEVCSGCAATFHARCRSCS